MAEGKNGTVTVEVAANRSAARLTIIAPVGSGTPATIEDARDALAHASVTYGVNNDALTELVGSRKYSIPTVVAEWSAPADGAPGEIEYLFPQTDLLAPRKNERGEVDYRDLGLVNNVLADTLIAKIKLPTDPTDGTDVCGNSVAGKPGQPARYLVGKGSYLTDDGTEIRAGVDGNLRWDKNHFVVDEVLVIAKNVDVTTGNINFIGSVNIKGEIKEGFTVTSKKDVTVSGSVTQATIIADGNIKLNLGCINSNITAKGDVNISFCEGSKIECDGNLSAQSFVGCEVFCGSTILATTGKGVIVGGKFTALIGFDVNTIGSENYTKTHVTLGKGAVLSTEKQEQEDKISDLEEQIVRLAQVANMLQETKKKMGSLTPDRENMLTTAIRSRFTLSREIKQRESRIAEINAELVAAADTRIMVRKDLWPGVKIRLGTQSMKIDNHWAKTMVLLDPKTGEIAFKPII
ncbi:polymerase [Clostridia bacterium]|nr:polymerase [Clostridia bacterium]